MSPYVRIYCRFDIFCTIGTVLGQLYFSTAVASAGCFFLVVTNLPVLKFWVIIFFSLLLESMIGIYARLSLRKQHQIFFESFQTLTIFWQSSASFWSVRSGSFSNFDKTLRLISASFPDTRPCANIRHLKLSADNSPSLKSSQFLLTTEENPK